MKIALVIVAVLMLASLCVMGQVAAGVHIAEVQFVGDTKLKDVDLTGCAADVKTGRFEGPSWEKQVTSYVKSICLQDNGYFTARVTTSTKQLADKNGTHQFLVTINIEAGPQYRLGEVRFTGNQAIASMELRALFQAQPGNVFRLRAVRDGIALMRKSYKAHGYPDFTPIPDFSIDNAKRVITVIIDIDEGKRTD
jgi:outer membrane protein assembly factor BamA